MLYVEPAGSVYGKLETGRDELREMARRRALAPPGGLTIDHLGPGRGFVATVPLGSPRGPALLLVAARGPLEELQPVAARAAAVSILIVLAVAATLGLVVFRALTARLGAVSDRLALVAAGDLAARLDNPGDDEIGDLGRSFNLMAERLEQLVRELGDVDAKRRQLLADLSHELKTPITAPADGRRPADLERLLEERAGQAGSARGPDRGGAAIAFEEVNRLALLVDDLLELSRLDSPRFELRVQEEVLQRLATRALERFEVALANRRIRVVTDLSEEPIRKSVDARRLEQALANLILNAVQSMPDGGQIELAVHETAGRATISIADDGAGIPEPERARVFERFFTGREGKGGTGLGLAIVKRLVESHGGTVRLEGREPRGTRAVIELEMPCPRTSSSSSK
ncbi:MAG: HAMP domain-containing histidine kinase [Candidatus Riflebacteria bacterium]|nr:HAMP domain-containing histidine kinase [Candidatus Riflebacteria bacterium]